MNLGISEKKTPNRKWMVFLVVDTNLDGAQ